MRARFPRWSVLLAAASLFAGLLGVVGTAAPASAYGSTIAFTGHGWGHGRGAGQYGSLGYALDHGWSYSSILDHYYGNSHKATRAESLMTVNLTEIEDRDLIVTSGSPFRIDRGDGDVWLDVPAGQALRVRRTGQGWAVDKANDCGGGGGWALQKFWISPDGDATYYSSDTPRVGTAYSGEDINKMMKVCGPTGNVRSYRGILTAFGKNPTGSWAVNTLPTELYLRGVVPRESPAYWGSLGDGKGMQSLKTQAVAARSYALAEQRTLAIYKTCDTISCQVYGGAGLNGQVIEHPNTDAAIQQTAGEIREMDSNNAVARTEFSSSTGGYTAGGTFSAVPDDGDDVSSNPNHNWSTSINTSEVEAVYDLGTLQSIVVTSRNGLGADGGRVKSIKLTGTKRTVTTTGAGFASHWSSKLKSDWFSVSSISVARVSGMTRLETAIAQSKDLYKTSDSAQAIVLASARSFADALVGVPLAVKKNGPMLLTYPEGLDGDTLAEIQRVTPTTAPVYLLGGPVVISDHVKTQLNAVGYANVQRIAGATRYSTAVEVAKVLGDPTMIFEVTGENFPDGLAAGAAAAKTNGAVLLTIDRTQASETVNYLQGRSVTRIAVGGAAAAADPGANEKIVGSDRYDTAVKLAIRFFPYPNTAGLASGETFADGLSGGVHAVKSGGPLVLTSKHNLSTPTRDYFVSASISSLARVVIYGGPAAVSDQVASEISAL
jgi:SpoIID/LytB domain protein